MDDYQFLEESQREALRREAIKKTNEELAKENIRAAEASKEAWVDALTGVVTGTRDASDVLKQIWQEQQQQSIFHYKYVLLCLCFVNLFYLSQQKNCKQCSTLLLFLSMRVETIIC